MRSKRAGFTLIELLVVIAIIAILAAILFPVFTRARSAGAQASCKSNLMQIGRAFTMYMDDYGQIVPPNTSGFREWNLQNPPGWTGMAYRYTKKIDIFRCPSRKQVNFAYSMNEAVGHMSGLPPRPSKVLLVGECPGSGPFFAENDASYPSIPGSRFSGDCNIATGGTGGQNDGWTCDAGKYNPEDDINKHANNYINAKRYSFDCWKQSGAYKDSHFIFFPGPHNGSTNVLFMDGHVGNYKNWNQDQMTFGWNYANGAKTPRRPLVTYP